ncbi:chemotaxis protein CheW [Roseomonas frigidaquae]|uniref:Chemotaxis protein CheW n=1 Tax=Falsiroseomonas frigidaquae TaxID=487318 RepID=A0ABX1ERP9_9PROT|nr:chemotaxis protein CheW [Falsiroseomonas frigidaquae]NKE43300.1 chemotaxis protein CheW [Falsiroseomonas frigidaquae]
MTMVADEARMLLTLEVGGRLCGVPVPRIRDVIRCERIARVPMAPAGVAGVLNLRGRIVTAVDLRERLGLPPADADAQRMSVVVEQQAELYSLLADSVGDVLTLPPETRTDVPTTLRGAWREHAVAVHRLDDQLLIELDTDRLLAFGACAVLEGRR